MAELNRAIAADAALLKKVRIVWLLDEHRPIAPCLALPELQKTPVKVPVASRNEAMNRLESQGLDRLARALRGHSLGIAFAGGAAKGMAHLGVLQVLETAGIIDG